MNILNLLKPSPTPKYPHVIEEIHNAFNTAGDQLLDEVKCFLQNLDESDKNKVSRLGALGFKKANQVVIAEKRDQDKAYAQTISKLIAEYSFKYPNNKFITEEMVGAICKKYSLVKGDVTLYQGFVPERNLAEIENFITTYKLQNCAQFVANSSSNERRYAEIFSLDKYTKNFANSKRGTEYYEINGVAQFHKIYNSDDYYCGFIFCVDGIKRYGLITPVSLQICAPIKDMDTTGMELDGYNLKKHIPDPVVLQPVTGGYLIITAWGDEASDELVVNPKFN